ncbi:hypothetical protein OU415_06375 [Saccharopolyspora sp. WRP15-2]|uniref:SH3 domain-containing protein n=1 Tax=Saccharopolyspora oryzae TaxID=2997343 RepID=A0ABT4UV21_9PSEU|nr:hypothetical protein [Saccharopolyspora oryzae]MDA3625051.1 hypothetical protein [Saccharopolyspora oryzae]
MKKISAVCLGALFAALSLAPVSAASAATSDQGISAQETRTTVRNDIPGLPARTAPYPDAPIHSTTPPGAILVGICWSEGGYVEAWGAAHNKWVLADNSAGGLWVWGGGLVGNETGNVNNHC